jgi:hypothetical protein
MMMSRMYLAILGRRSKRKKKRVERNLQIEAKAKVNLRNVRSVLPKTKLRKIRQLRNLNKQYRTLLSGKSQVLQVVKKTDQKRGKQ